MDFRLVPGDGHNNYTGFVTKTIVYVGTLIFFLASVGLTISSIAIPRWLSYDSVTPIGGRAHITYGLTSRCTTTGLPRPIFGGSGVGSGSVDADNEQSLIVDPLSTSSAASISTSASTGSSTSTTICTAFPPADGSGYCSASAAARALCTQWRSAAYGQTVAVAAQGVAVVTYGAVLAGDKRRREDGWRLLAVAFGVGVAAQTVPMGLVTHVLTTNPTLSAGDAHLGLCWVLSLLSALLTVGCALAVVLAGKLLPSEGGYELIPEETIREGSDG